MASITSNLKLRLADDLTSDARFNLNRIDTIGSSNLIDNQGNLKLRAKSDIQLQPQSNDIGGTGTGGTVTIGESGTSIAKVDIYSTDVDLNSSNLNVESGLLKFTDGSNFVALQTPASFTGDTTFVLPGDDGSAGQALSTDGSGNLSFASFASGTLNTNNIDIGNGSNVRTATNTSSVGDILADSSGGLTIKAGAIVDADINSSASIALTKLATVAANRAIESDASGRLTASTVTTTELGYLSGVSSNIQDQIDLLGSANQLAENWLNADGLTKTITHNFGTRNIAVQVLDVANDYVEIDVECITRPNDNDIVLTSNQAPQSSWRVLLWQVGT